MSEHLFFTSERTARLLGGLRLLVFGSGGDFSCYIVMSFLRKRKGYWGKAARSEMYTLEGEGFDGG